MKFIISVCLFIFFMSSAFNSFSQIKITDEEVTRRVFKHHDEAFGKRDLTSILADYTEESILVTPDKTYIGLKELKGFFEEAFKLFDTDSIEGETMKEVIIKDIVYTVWRVKTPKLNLDYATETFFIQNGKIIRQTFAGRKVN
jgi:hypothetical protein